MVLKSSEVAMNFVLCILALLAFLPQLRALPKFNMIWPLVLAVWLAMAFLVDKRFFVKVTLHRLACYCFVLYTISVAFMSGNMNLGNRYLELSQVLVFYMAFQFALARGKVVHLSTVVGVIFTSVVYTSFKTLFALHLQPNIARTAKKDTLAGLSQMAEGIGGYDFIYMLVFLVIPLVYLIFIDPRKIKTRYQVLGLSFAVLFSYVVFRSNFSTALLLIIMSVLFRLALIGVTRKTVFLVFFFGLTLLPLLPTLLLLGIDESSKFLGNTMNSQRLEEIRLLLSSGVIDISLGARLDAFLLSGKTALLNPVGGVIFTQDPAQLMDMVGQHSLLLDTFAIYGVVIGGLTIYIFFQPLVKLLVDKGVPFSLSLSVSMFWLIFCTLNNVTPSTGLVIYLILPFLVYVYKDAVRETG